MNRKSKKERSHGVVPLCQIEGIWHVLLIQHKSAKYWGFPKGHAELHENPRETAIRELKEETNLDIEYFFSDETIQVDYDFLYQGIHISKTVSFFTAVVKGDVILQQEEVCSSRWITLSEAFLLLTYDTDKTVLQNSIRSFFPDIFTA